jgi:hypothetical protein
MTKAGFVCLFAFAVSNAGTSSRHCALSLPTNDRRINLYTAHKHERRCRQDEQNEPLHTMIRQKLHELPLLLDISRLKRSDAGTKIALSEQKVEKTRRNKR